MAQSAISESSLPEPLSRHRQIVLDLVKNGIEDDTLEGKTQWRIGRDDLVGQIKTIKIIAGMANLSRSSEGYFVIGADIANKTFQNVENLTEFDPAKIDDLLGKFLDPKPLVQVYEFDNSFGGRFVVIVISPSQRKPITVRKNSDKDGTSIREGEIWIKSGTITRLASRRQIEEMYEEKVEAEAETRARQRFTHFRDEFAIAPNYEQSPNRAPDMNLILSPRSTLRSFIADSLAKQDHRRLFMLLELLRDVLVLEWVTLHRTSKTEYVSIEGTESQGTLNDFSSNRFTPALIALTEFCLMCVKHQGEVTWLDPAIDILKEHFDFLSKLREEGLGRQLDAGGQHNWSTLAQVYASLRCIAVYAVSRARFKFLRPVHSVSVDTFDERGTFSGVPKLLIFFPLHAESKNDDFLGGRIEFVWKTWALPYFPEYFSAQKGFIEAALSHELLIELNSFLALGYADMSRPLNAIRVDNEFSWTYYPEFHRYRSAEIGDFFLKLPALLSGPEPDILPAQRLVPEIRTLKIARDKVLNRFAYTIKRDADHPRSRASWHTFDAVVSKAAISGQEEERKLEGVSGG